MWECPGRGEAGHTQNQSRNLLPPSRLPVMGKAGRSYVVIGKHLRPMAHSRVIQRDPRARLLLYRTRPGLSHCLVKPPPLSAAGGVCPCASQPFLPVLRGTLPLSSPVFCSPCRQIVSVSLSANLGVVGSHPPGQGGWGAHRGDGLTLGPGAFEAWAAARFALLRDWARRFAEVRSVGRGG